MKPFIEVSIVERVMEHSKVRQYKYYKVLIQEFHVKVDMGLVNALMGMFPQRTLTEQEAVRHGFLNCMPTRVECFLLESVVLNIVDVTNTLLTF